MTTPWLTVAEKDDEMEEKLKLAKRLMSYCLFTNSCWTTFCCIFINVGN